MHGSRIVERRCRPRGAGRNRVEALGKYGPRRLELIRRLADRDGVQPYNVFAVMIDFGSVVIDGLHVMGFEMPVNGGMRMPDVRFVDVFGRQRRQESDARRQYQTDDCPQRCARHAGVIMVADHWRGQIGGPALAEQATTIAQARNIRYATYPVESEQRPEQ